MELKQLQEMLYRRGLLFTLLAAAILEPAAAAAAAGVSGRLPITRNETPEFWSHSAMQQMAAAEQKWRQLRHVAKSAILFIGDGMGPTTVTAGRILKGQLANTSGEEAELEFDQFPHVGLIKTYSTDGQTPDSSATATAYLAGAKTNDGVVGVNQQVTEEVCSTYDPQKHDLKSFLVKAQLEGRSVGLVTTTRITHATPAAAYANSPSREWESDSLRDGSSQSPDTVEQRSRCKDIATQLIDKAINFSVILGGGRLKFLPKTNSTIDHSKNRTVFGERNDNIDLIELWKQRHENAGRRARYVETTEELLNIDASSTDHLLGLMATSHLDYRIEGLARSGYRQPTLAQMVEVALRILQRNDKGFLLLIESGRIDHGHHGNRAQAALHEVITLDEAVGVAKRLTSIEDTLLVVSADHSHVFTFGHYGRRGQPILGLLRTKKNDSVLELARDKLPFTALHYADGRSAEMNAGRKKLTTADVEHNSKFRYQSLLPRGSESHGGEDVAVYASGPGAQLFTSVQEQSYIAHAIMKVTCVGWYRSNSQCLQSPEGNGVAAAAAAAWPLLLSLLLTLLLHWSPLYLR